MHHSMWLAPVGLALAACAPPAAEQVDFAAEEAAVRAVNVSWLELARAKNAAGIAALFVEDGTLFAEDREPVVGRTAIQAYMADNFVANPNTIPDWSGDRVELATSGDFAVEYGTWQDTDSDGAELDRGKYVTVFRKVNGTWMVETDMSLSIKPEPEPET